VSDDPQSCVSRGATWLFSSIAIKVDATRPKPLFKRRGLAIRRRRTAPTILSHSADEQPGRCLHQHSSLCRCRASAQASTARDRKGVRPEHPDVAQALNNLAAPNGACAQRRPTYSTTGGGHLREDVFPGPAHPIARIFCWRTWLHLYNESRTADSPRCFAVDRWPSARRRVRPAERLSLATADFVSITERSASSGQN